MDSGITQLEAQGPAGTCNESKEEEEDGADVYVKPRGICIADVVRSGCHSSVGKEWKSYTPTFPNLHPQRVR